MGRGRGGDEYMGVWDRNGLGGWQTREESRQQEKELRGSRMTEKGSGRKGEMEGRGRGLRRHE